MKRILWTVAMAIAGFAIGWLYQGSGIEHRYIVVVTFWIIFTIWFAMIGFGFGSIFAKPRPKNGLFVFYWATTIALVAEVFAGFVPLAFFPAKLAVAGAAGALLGGIFGFAQLKFSDRQQNSERSMNG